MWYMKELLAREHECKLELADRKKSGRMQESEEGPREGKSEGVRVTPGTIDWGLARKKSATRE